MARLDCLRPKSHPKLIGMVIPCRKCEACKRSQRSEWTNRMKLEQFGRSYKPLFVTWTFSPENYDDSHKTCLESIQKTWKRLRRANHDIRYFSVIERGELKNRLHAHSIIYSESISNLSPANKVKVLQRSWSKGIVDVSQVRSAAGLAYTTKYISKDLLEDIDRETGFVKKHRNYSWSNNPAFGNSGIQHWIKQVKHYHLQVRFNKDYLPPGSLIIPILGSLQRVWIPLSTYIKVCKEHLGIEFTQEEISDSYEENINRILTNDETSIVSRQKRAEEYRKAKGIFCT